MWAHTPRSAPLPRPTHKAPLLKRLQQRNKHSVFCAYQFAWEPDKVLPSILYLSCMSKRYWRAVKHSRYTVQFNIVLV